MFKEIYEKYIVKYYGLFIAIGVTTLLTSLAFYLIYESIPEKETEDIVVLSDIAKPDVNHDVEEEEQYVYVDIKGAITKPNVYQMIEGSRIVDVIKKAGGLTDKADTRVLNLSKKVNDEMVIIIYTKDELNNFKDKSGNTEEIIKYIEKECICPDPILNDGCINDDIDNKDEISTKISLNNSTKEELMELPGIGETKAQDIIDYRISNNLFKSIDELKNVNGIGESTFDQIKDLVTL